MTYLKNSKVDLIVDIETVVNPVTAQEVAEYMAAWQPPGSVKLPETVLRHREEAQRKSVDTLMDAKRFSLGGKRMVSCALGEVASNGNVVNVQSWQSDELSDITQGIVGYLNDSGEYRLIGWNHGDFDLPEIVRSFYLTGVSPNRKPSKWDIIDLCANGPFRKKKLKDVAKGLGLEVMDVDGSDVGRLYEEKNWSKIKEYNEYDVTLTGQVFSIANMLYSFY